jgi:hypothetical protein
LVERCGISIASIGDTPFFVAGLEEVVPTRFISLLRQTDGQFPGFDTLYAGGLPGGRPNGDRLTIDQTLAHPIAQSWLRSKEVSGVLVWDYSDTSEAVCQEAGIKLLASPRHIVRAIEDKVELQKVLAELGLPILPHLIIVPQSIPSWSDVGVTCGADVVIQSAVNNSNGSFTYRVRSEGEYQDVVSKHRHEALKVAACVSGGSFNLGGVVLSHQFVPGIGTRQLVGIPELTAVPFAYCGNEAPLSRWFSVDTIETAWRDLVRLSEFVRDSGYRGLIGVDFVVDDDGVPYIVDINPRMQSSQGLGTALHIENGLTPIVLLHALHHLGFEVDVDEDRYWNVARESDTALSQLVMFHIGECDFGSGALRPGTIDLPSGVALMCGTSLLKVYDRDQGILHRACERGRCLTPNATMLAVQVWQTVLRERDVLQPWVVSLVHALRRNAVLSSSQVLGSDVTSLRGSEDALV